VALQPAGLDDAVREAAFVYLTQLQAATGSTERSDANVLGVRPDHKVEIRPDVLVEADGPTLRHALQGLHGEVIALPERRAERRAASCSRSGSSDLGRLWKGN
jgi:hypothetical protein